MRAYFFGNMYISPIQHGIQAAHVVTEMFVKYARGRDEFSSNQEEILYEWAKNHKTMILLNGGYGENLHDLHTFMKMGIAEDLIGLAESRENPYPFAKFHESEAALDNALTSVGIILPERIYNGAQAMRKVKRMRRDDNERLDFEQFRVLNVRINDELESVQFTEFEVELMERLGSFQLV